MLVILIFKNSYHLNSVYIYVTISYSNISIRMQIIKLSIFIYTRNKLNTQTKIDSG